ncbi:MAG TPA: SGNH/GDSL hydrolase family protein [Polyangia bacterium]
MTRHLVANVLLAAALSVGGACSSGDGIPNGGTGGSASGGTTATGGGSDGATGGEATGGQTTVGTGGIGGMPEQGGGHSGAGGVATGGHPSGGMGGSVLTGTGGGGAGGVGGATSTGGAGSVGGAASTGGAGGRGGAGGTGGAGSVGGATSTGGAGGTVAYAPCPTNGSPCKILPFGDSITRGVKSSDDAGYRSQLFKLVVGAKQRVTFTGSLTNGPTQVSGQPFPRMHEGHPGWTIDPGYNPISSSYGGISSLVPSPALDAHPNIILLHIGTNDLYARDTAGMATRLEALLDKIAQNAPDALIVLAQITPGSTPNAARDAYNAKIPGIVQSHAATGQHIIGVDMSKLPLADLSSDGTHPNDQGYAYMAGIWYAAIKDLLPK